MEIQLGHPGRQRIGAGASVVKYCKGFTLIELLIMVLVAAIMAAAAIPRLFSIADNATMSAGHSILSALETANSLTFSRQLTRGITGPYTMGDILSNVDIKGVESSEVTVSSYKVRVQGRWYVFDLSAAPDVPSCQGSINMAVAAFDVSGDPDSVSTDTVPPTETNRTPAEHREDWWSRLWNLLQHIFGRIS
jgi:prepilin-type N-terminal cleavage/methylation domain-containing protein